MILRQSDGSVVFSAYHALWHCSSALEAEMMACLEGIRLAIDMGHQNIIIETELLHMMSTKKRIGSAIGHLAEDLRMLLASEYVSSFVKILRVCNSASHELAIHRDCINSISTIPVRCNGIKTTVSKESVTKLSLWAYPQ
jgi:hypothetical protein